ncbi:MAG: hypothetical protein JO246_07585 [Frankiaceae bacterium]|nr:hypothetical protein [Frankiaceae bacterium]
MPAILSVAVALVLEPTAGPTGGADIVVQLKDPQGNEVLKSDNLWMAFEPDTYVDTLRLPCIFYFQNNEITTEGRWVFVALCNETPIGEIPFTVRVR